MKQKILNVYFKLLGTLARRYIRRNKPYIIGINGSVGKTSCRMIVADVLKKMLPTYDIYTSPKNFNGELGMSLSIFRIEDYTPGIMGLIKSLFTGINKARFSRNAKTEIPTILILEYGIDHPGEMDFLISIAKPHCTIHTQIDSVHSEQFGDPDHIAREEFLLEQNTLDIVFMNKDDPYAKLLDGTIPCDIITYSASNKTPNTTVQFSSTNITNLPHTDAALQHAIITFNEKKSLTVGLSILGIYHMAYAGVGLCIADIISQKFSGQPAFIDGSHIDIHTELQPGRRSVFNGIHDSIVIDSTYNASPRSVKEIIEEVTQRRDNKHSHHKLLFVLGDMRELGSQEQHEHESLAKFMQGYDATLVLVGQAMKRYAMSYFDRFGLGRIQKLQRFQTYRDAGQYIQSFLLQNNQDNYIIVLKGSQNTIFLEEAVKYILQNPSDEAKLTRQSPWREKKKKEFLKTYKS